MTKTKIDVHKTITLVVLMAAVTSAFVIVLMPIVADIDQLASGTALPLKRYRGAIIKTNFGEIEIAFNQKTPKAVNNFIKLSASRFYDQTRFHRVVKNLLIQGGDPLTADRSLVGDWGHGGPGYFFPDEIYPDDQMVQGTVAMANNGSDTNGSQFFILTNSAAWLNGHHTIFARVTRGIETVLRIAEIPTSITDIPVQEVVLTQVVVLRKHRVGMLFEPILKRASVAEARPLVSGHE